MSVRTAIDRLDRRLVYATGRLRRRYALGVVRWVSRTGDGYAPLVCLILAALVDTDVATAFLRAALLAFAIERALYVLAKRFFKRRRPAEVLPQFVPATTPADRFSFPSGHTMAAVLTACLAVSVLGVPAVLAYGWAMAVGFSRVWLGVHFPSDIVVGAVLGIGIGLFALGVLV